MSFFLVGGAATMIGSAAGAVASGVGSAVSGIGGMLGLGGGGASGGLSTGIGGGGGFMGSGYGISGGIAGLTSPAALAPTSVFGTSLATTGATAGGLGATIGGIGSALTSPMIPGIGFTSPLMLGAAGLGLMSGSKGSGSSFQTAIPLSKEGEALKKTYETAARGKLAKAKKGDVTDKAFQSISDAKVAESLRHRGSQEKINTIQARIGNEPKDRRGGGTVGGDFVKAQLIDTGERMTGLFEPSSILNNYRKEGLINASKEIQNLANLDNQTAQFSYAGNLAKWSADQNRASQKGAAIGSVFNMIGSSQLSMAYNREMTMAA